MKAVYASTVNHADPLAALAVGEQPEPQARPFWSTVSVLLSGVKPKRLVSTCTADEFV